jgi:hypothetical protein
MACKRRTAIPSCCQSERGFSTGCKGCKFRKLTIRVENIALYPSCVGPCFEQKDRAFATAIALYPLTYHTDQGELDFPEAAVNNILVFWLLCVALRLRYLLSH